TNIGRSSIRDWTQKFGISRRRGARDQAGIKNPRWNGGISKLKNNFRKVVKERVNYTCEICGNKNNIDAHHIKFVSSFPELQFDINNGMALCRSCHRREHRGGD
ncbi:hypothetical protein LCGC14_2462460, partial [marine sediment metagenome]